MHSTQILQVLAVALSTFNVAHAGLPDLNVQAAMGHQLAKRQSGSGTGTTSPAQPTTPTTTSPRTTPTTTSPTTPPRTTTPSSPSQSTPTTTAPSPPPTTTSTSAPSPTRTTEPLTEKTPEPTTTAPPTTSTWTSTVVVTDPNNGQVSTITSEGTTTHTPGLAGSNNSNNQQSGMSTEQRNTIIGVVCGIGGAIVLGVVGIVAWRVWGRKKSQETDEGAFGSSYTPAEKPEQPGSQSSRTPFQSTLESYHAPTQVNTASNF